MNDDEDDDDAAVRAKHLQAVLHCFILMIHFYGSIFCVLDFKVYILLGFHDYHLTP